TTRSSPWTRPRPRTSGSGGCATPGAGPSTARPATSGSATWARTAGRRSTSCRRGGRGSTSAGTAAGGTNHTPRRDSGHQSTSSVAGALVPVSEYDHSFGNAIIGGYVYRGSAIPEIQGLYFFSDNGSGFVRSFWANAPVSIDRTLNWNALAKSSIATYGEDQDGELLICSIGGGRCWKIVRG